MSPHALRYLRVLNHDSGNHPTDVSIITTYRCQMRCVMCSIWENPTDKKREITAKELEILPKLKFCNITGGEPFVRSDLDEIFEVMMGKADDVVVSTSGWHVDRILASCEKFPRLGVRVSIEGLSQSNDHLRGRKGGFDRALRLLLELKKKGQKNIGFGMTVSNQNSRDLLPMYRLATELGLEFATATFHNSFYFHKYDNVVTNQDEVTENFAKLVDELLKEDTPKSWFRALYNLGLIRYIRGMPRMLPCEAGSANFFVYPYGDVYPCNGLEPKYWVEKMGNIREAKTFDDIWFSDQAKRVREKVRTCAKNCWMVGTAAPVMKKYISKTGPWVAKHKAMSVLGRSPSLENLPYFDVGQDPLQGDLRLGNGDAQPIAEELEQVAFQGDFEDDNRLVQLGARANAAAVLPSTTPLSSPSAGDAPPAE